MSSIRVSTTEWNLITYCDERPRTYSQIADYLLCAEATARRLVGNLRKKGVPVEVKLRHPGPPEVDQALEPLRCDRTGGICPVLAGRLIESFKKETSDE